MTAGGAVLQVMFRSANAVRDLYAALALIYSNSDIKRHLPTRNERVAKLAESAKGPLTFCTLMAQIDSRPTAEKERELAPLLSTCPQKEVNTLWKQLGNLGSPDDMGKFPVVYMPDVQIRPFTWRRVVSQKSRNPKDFYGHLIDKLRSAEGDYIADITGLSLRVLIDDVAAADLAATVVEEQIRSDIVVDVIELDRNKDPNQSSRPYSQDTPEVASATVKIPFGFWQLLPWREGWKPDERILSCRDDGKAAIINLFDQPVANHPDLGVLTTEPTQGISEDEPRTIQRFDPLPVASPMERACQAETVDFDRKTHHGTHLAAIMVGRNKENGFIGLGCASSLRVIDINNFKSIDLQTMVQNFLKERRPQIFVSASLFLAKNAYLCPINNEKISYPEGLVNTGFCDLKEADADDPRWGNTFAKQLEKQKPLWVTAAGQKDAGKAYAPFRLSDRAAMVPMNLGDQSSVIVVTACHPCSSSAAGDGGNDGVAAALWPDSYYSVESSEQRTSFVHVAAPGVDVVAPVASGQCAKASGTSQAAAFVGGVVAAMVNDHTSAYFDDHDEPRRIRACKLKRRVQITSVPTLRNTLDLKRIAAGIVDPAVALLDPEKVWFCQTTPDNKTRDTCNMNEYKSIDKDSFSWCVNKFGVANDDRDENPEETRRSFRLFRLGEAAGLSPRSSKFMIYVDPQEVVRDEPTCNIYRRGPRMIQISQASGKLFQGRIDGRQQFVMLDEVKDIILPESNLKVTPCN